MANELRMSCLRRSDQDGQPYYFTVPNMPATVDLSKCVIFIRPQQDSDGVDIVVKPYIGKAKREGELDESQD